PREATAGGGAQVSSPGLRLGSGVHPGLPSTPSCCCEPRRSTLLTAAALSVPEEREEREEEEEERLSTKIPLLTSPTPRDSRKTRHSERRTSVSRRVCRLLPTPRVLRALRPGLHGGRG
ncbi:unnamed protein product, partial [Pylaiella littoralis]